MRRYYSGIASMLFLICITAFLGFSANAFEIIFISDTVKIISVFVALISCYTGAFFYCLELKTEAKAKKFMRNALAVIFGFYIIIILDFTLIDNSFGRDIFNILNWNSEAFKSYLGESTNLIPFATIKLFINGFASDRLTVLQMIMNIFGNFFVFMPLPFFISIFSPKIKGGLKILSAVLSFVVAVELLQLVFMTGALDIDDVILNVSGAMLFYYISQKKKVSEILSKMTFGTWKNDY